MLYYYGEYYGEYYYGEYYYCEYCEYYGEYYIIWYYGEYYIIIFVILTDLLYIEKWMRSEKECER